MVEITNKMLKLQLFIYVIRCRFFHNHSFIGKYLNLAQILSTSRREEQYLDEEIVDLLILNLVGYASV